MRLNRENTIAIVVDMQEKLMPRIYSQEKLVSTILKLINGLKILQVPILVTQQNTKALGSTIPEIHETFENFSSIEKLCFSCCDEPAFVEKLEHFDKKIVLILGVEAHICILQTTLDLLNKNYQTVVVDDCIGAANEYEKQMAILRMREEGSLITTSESLLFELCSEAGTNEFRQILKLIKEEKNA